MNRKKFEILLTSPSIDPSKNIGGISSLTKLLTEKSKNIEFSIFVLGKEDINRRNLKWLLKQIFIPFRFALFLKRNNPELIHLNTPFAPLALARDYLISKVALLFSKKYILHIRGGKYLSQECNFFFINTIIHRLLISSTNIIVLGVNEKQKLLFRYKNIDANKISVIPNAVTVLDNELMKNKKYDGVIQILYLGRLDKNKGFPEIVAAINGLTNRGIHFEFTVCGEGPYKTELVSSMTLTLNKSVKFLGVVSGKEKHDILLKSHIFLLPSYYEGLPNALLEAMGNGCVPIVTQVGSIPEVVDDLSNGFMVPLHDSEVIIDVITLLETDRKLLKEIGHKARQTIDKRFNIDNYLDKLTDIYNNSI